MVRKKVLVITQYFWPEEFRVNELVRKLTSMGYEEFYSPLEILKDYDASKYQHNLAQDYIQNK